MANLEYRARIREAAIGDKGLRRDLIEMCKLDTLFFFSVFLEVIEPRERDAMKRIRPFVPRPAQQVAVFQMEQVWGRSDAVWEKSRGEGATYLVVGRMLKAWLWEPFFKGAIASKSEKDVDAKDEMSSVMPKIDYQLSRLPYWMRPAWKDVRRTSEPPLLANLTNGAGIRGYACSDDLGTGGRVTVWLWDEMAKFRAGKDQEALDSTSGTSNCRMLVSTYAGTTNCYAKIARDPDSGLVKIRLPWWHNPERNQGLFTLDERDNPVPVDVVKFGEPDVDFLDLWPAMSERLAMRGYKFPRGKLLSPWYCRECLRAGMFPRSMAQEYDMDPQGTESCFFQAATVDDIKRRTAEKPWGRYSLSEDANGEPILVANPQGPLRAWCLVDKKGRPVIQSSNVIGCDISQGVTTDRSTNSVAAIFSARGKQVAEYVTRSEDPGQFAESSVKLGKLFAYLNHDAFLIWEHEGSVASRFFKRLDELKYRRIYRREKLDTDGRTRTVQPGVVTSNSKDVVLGEFREAYHSGEIVVKSEEGHDELHQFVYDANGKLVNIHEKNADDPSGVGRNHADRVMAYAVSRVGLTDQPVVAARETEDIRPGSMAWRQQERQRVIQNHSG